MTQVYSLRVIEVTSVEKEKFLISSFKELHAFLKNFLVYKLDQVNTPIDSFKKAFNPIMFCLFSANKRKVSTSGIYTTAPYL